MSVNTFLSEILILVLCFSGTLWAATYGGGSGTEADPYQIRTPEQMNTLGATPGDWSKSFELMADLDMSMYTGTQYNLIGNATTQFTGTFDGGGHTLRNLTYSTTAVVNYVGLFGLIYDAVIQNLNVENVSISSGGIYLGGLVGYNSSSFLTACSVTGSVSGTGTGLYSYVGGLTGLNYGSLLTACTATGSVSGTGALVGGLVGDSYGSLIDCCATGSVSGTFEIGGLAGRNWGTISHCYATGWVSGTDSLVGGLVGYNNNGMVLDCFWDTDTSGQTTSDGGTGKTTAEMKTLSTFTDAVWDFENTWAICEMTNYPRLQWQIPIGDFVCPDGVTFEDFAFFARHWLEPGGGTVGGAELTGDGVVDIEDLMVFCAHWLKGI